MGYKFVLSISLVVYYMKGQASLLGAVLWKPNEECFPLRDLAKNVLIIQAQLSKASPCLH